jgi:hypothetical protein
MNIITSPEKAKARLMELIQHGKLEVTNRDESDPNKYALRIKYQVYCTHSA